MTKNVVIVESPAKCKTLEKYLGKGFKVLASFGHVRDLIPKEGAVETDNHFLMHYQAIEKSEKQMALITKAVKSCETLYLATDPDREGEAISWHVHELLNEKGRLKGKTVHRIAFHQITKSAVKEAIAHPRALSQDLIDAQQARRALDYLVGFNLSPLLWRKIRRGLSAGRVQSPALCMIVEREQAIESFEPKEYWTVTGDCESQGKKKQAIDTRLVVFEDKKLEQFSITDESQADHVKAIVEKAANGTLHVTKVDKKQRKRQPTAPFITSTLQQEAVRKLGFTAQRAMRAAQQLYEGVDVGEGSTGLITYMRTDSVAIAVEAIEEMRTYIVEKYGKENLPSEPRTFKTKSKNAQEAHEAIRPTSILRAPDEIKTYLSVDQFKLYNLIWKRTLASQMMHATFNTVAIDLQAGSAPHYFRANGSVMLSPGFILLYQEGADDAKGASKDEDKLLPPLEVGDEVTLKEVACYQHFTEPPPRFSEASLVKALEEHGIGRPSTYASIIATLQNREYVRLETKRFYPTDVGRVVSRFLTDYFTQYVDYNFTSDLEDHLDAVARGEKKWVPLLEEFWRPFTKLITLTDEKVQRSDVTQEAMDEACPECKKPLSIRLGRRGRFIGCTAYPDCKYTRSVDEAENEEDEHSTESLEGRLCSKCESPLIIKRGPYGKFIGCSGYPDCKFIESLEKPTNTEVRCPECKQDNMLKRKSRKGKIFFSCARYPECKYATWDEPLDEACPSCEWPILTKKVTKARGEEKVCPQQECKYKEKIEEQDEKSS
jgi:DNA topoisomerase-1